MPEIEQRVMRHDDHRDGGPSDHSADATAALTRNRVLVVVPAFNEERSIAAVVRQVQSASAEYDVVVIDDGSSDATAAAARATGAYVISLPFNLGIGGAMQTGFMFAAQNGYDYMAQIDGDGQHDPSALKHLIAVMTGNPGLDLVYGSRFLAESSGYRPSLARVFGIRLFAFTLTHLLHQPVSDPTSGFRLWGRRAIELFAASYPHDYPEVESLLLLHAGGFRFAELAVPMRARAAGRSSITPTRSVYYMVKVYLALVAGSFRPRVGMRHIAVRSEI